MWDRGRTIGKLHFMAFGSQHEETLVDLQKTTTNTVPVSVRDVSCTAFSGKDNTGGLRDTVSGAERAFAELLLKAHFISTFRSHLDRNTGCGKSL